jgi:hypothetical protein
MAGLLVAFRVFPVQVGSGLLDPGAALSLPQRRLPSQDVLRRGNGDHLVTPTPGVLTKVLEYTMKEDEEPFLVRKW